MHLVGHIVKTVHMTVIFDARGIHLDTGLLRTPLTSITKWKHHPRCRNRQRGYGIHHADDVHEPKLPIAPNEHLAAQTGITIILMIPSERLACFCVGLSPTLMNHRIFRLG